MATGLTQRPGKVAESRLATTYLGDSPAAAARLAESTATAIAA